MTKTEEFKNALNAYRNLDVHINLVLRLIGISAIEKQIPKKVIFEDDGDSLLCPNCGLELMGSITEQDHDPYYCFECGQALDWGKQNG